MVLSRWPAALTLAALLADPPAARAQVAGRSPRIGYVVPAGGRQGSSFQVVSGGQNLDGARIALVSGAGVRATVIEHTKPMTQKQLNDLRERQKELAERKSAARQNVKKRGGKDGPPDPAEPAQGASWSAEDERLLAEIRGKIAASMKRTSNPALAETVTLQVAIAPDAEPGERELRVGTPSGLTNPLIFLVGQLPEFREKGPEDAGGQDPGKKSKAEKAPRGGAAEAPTEIPLPAVVNGQILPGDVDRFRFAARKGQRLVVAASARGLIPYLPDAVPGWFQATLALYGPKGHELAYDDDFRFQPDPVLCREIPADGEYVIEIKDSIYRGREDFVYRIAVGELPFVTGIFPLGGRAGAPATIEMKGWNLPAQEMALGEKCKEAGIVPIRVSSGGLLSNPVPFLVDTLPEWLEREPNDTPAGAQRVELPIIVNGRADPPGDRDVFLLEGRAGIEIVAEVHARRLGSPLDSMLKLTDAAGKELAAGDDHEDKGAGLLTHHADSWLRATLPADGTYYLHLSDAQHKGGPEHAYRLRIGPPRPDFELRVVPSSINARAGMAVPITVHAIRKDGFSGEIVLELKDAPPGFGLSGGRVPDGQDQVRLTIVAPPEPPQEPIGLSLEGRAAIQGLEVRRPAVPAEDMCQAFAYRHLVPAKELLVAVAGRPAFRSAVKVLGEVPVRIPAGGTARVLFGVPANRILDRMEIELDEPPEGISIEGAAPSRGGTEIVLRCDASKVKPGLKGNLIAIATAKKTGASGKAKAQGNRRTAPLVTFPAIPFDVVAP